MRTVLPFLFLLFCCFAATAQEASNVAPIRNKSIYVEFLGNGIFGSVNFDTRLKKGQQDGHGIRIGVGGYPASRNNTTSGTEVITSSVTIPISYNYLVGRKRSAFEAGVGVTPIIGKASFFDANGEAKDVAGVTVAGLVNAGYRYQPLNSGFVFRFTWTPAITNEGFFPLWMGLSLGYGFK